jgi:hypothetical protein
MCASNTCYLYMSIYIERDRGRQRQREAKKGRKTESHMCQQSQVLSWQAICEQLEVSAWWGEIRRALTLSALEQQGLTSASSLHRCDKHSRHLLSTAVRKCDTKTELGTCLLVVFCIITMTLILLPLSLSLFVEMGRLTLWELHKWNRVEDLYWY